MNRKIWFININGKREGPFSISDLKRDLRITPDTLVWREGFAEWKKMRDVQELKEVFADEKSKDKEDLNGKGCLLATPRDEIILDLRKEPPYLFWMMMIILLALLYATFQFFWVR